MSTRLALALAASFAAAPPATSQQAKPNCKQAVSQSRMICLSGADCQKEISAILVACKTAPASCSAARQELQVYCGKRLPFDGSHKCESALQQVGHYCGR